MKEDWGDIEGYEGLYQVSSLGNVKSLDRKVVHKDKKITRIRERILKQGTTKKGYKIVYLSKECKKLTVSVHRLVALAFIPNPDNKATVNHKDTIKTNNIYTNLEWATNLENIEHSVKAGRYRKGEDSYRSILSKEKVLMIRFSYFSSCKTVKEIAKDFSLRPSHVKQIIDRKIWKHI